ncbi:MAG: hypothetical protein WD904_02145 [Dehalococcoidia bacterium]
MTRFRLLALLTSLVALSGGAFACGGSDDDDAGNGTTPTRSEDRDTPSDDKSHSPNPEALAEYFTAIDAIFEAADSAADNAQARLEATPEGAPLAEQKAAIDTFLTDIRGVFSDAAEAIDDLDAPEEVADDSGDFVIATEAAVDIATDLQGQIAGADTQQELDAIAATFDAEVSLTVADADAACENLQQIADDNDIAVDLDCED